MKSKVPKIILGILAAIFIAVLCWSLSPPIWFWIGFEVVSALLVAVGCVGELFLFHHPAGRERLKKEKHHKLESRFIFAVAIGVTMELLALTHAIPEAVTLENNVALANERTSTNELEVAVLNSNSLGQQEELDETKLQLVNADIELAKIKNAIPARQIEEKQKERFISVLLNSENTSPRPDIKVFVGDTNVIPDEAIDFADAIRGMLNESGYGTNGEQVIKIPPLALNPPENLKLIPPPQIFFISAVDNEGKTIPLSMGALGSIAIWTPTTNTILAEVNNPNVPTSFRYTTNPNDILEGICDDLGYIGFPPQELINSWLLKPGEVGLYIPPQVQ